MNSESDRASVARRFLCGFVSRERPQVEFRVNCSVLKSERFSMQFRRGQLSVVMCSVAVFAAAGCGGARQAVDSRVKVAVSGSVTVDGKPINGADVAVTLFPADNSAPLSIPLKADGSFSGQAVSGKNYVVVNAARTPEGGHSEGKTLGIGKLFLDNGSPLVIDAAAGASVKLEVGEAAAKTMEGQKRIQPGDAGAPSEAHAS